MNRGERARWAAVLFTYILVASGGHGWMFPWLRSLVEIALGTTLVLIAGETVFSVPGARLLPVVIGTWARHRYSVDALGDVGLLASLLMTAGAAARPTIRAIAAAAMLRLALTSVSGFYIEEFLAHVQSTVAGAITWRTVDLGPSFGGTRALATCAACLAAMYRLRDLRWQLPLLIIVGILASAAVALLVELIPAIGSSSPETFTALAATQVPWVPVLCLAGIGVFCVVRAESPVPQRRPVGLLAMAMGAALCVIVSAPHGRTREFKSVLFYEPGFQNWLTPAPDFSGAGQYSAGMLGTLPAFVEALGMRAKMTARVSEAELEDADTFVFVNHNRTLDGQEYAIIGDWVRRGGRLIVLGDHTALWREKPDGEPVNHLNQLLRFSRIEFANTSADHMTHGFRDATQHMRLGRALVADDENPSGSIIGASLSLRWPARPLIIGQYGYDDKGVADPVEGGRGALGNLAWDRGERLGDVVLVAQESVGQGQVVAVADTTGATNIGRSFSWSWWGGLLRGSFQERRGPYWGAAGGLLIVALGAVVAMVDKAAILLGFALVAAAGWCARAPALESPLVGRKPLGVIELATRPRAALGTWDGDGMLSLMVNLLRAQRLPVYADTSRDCVLEAATHLIISAPQVDPGEAWSEAIVRWVMSGGKLLIGVSYPDSRPVRNLLRRLGAEVRPRVLGPTRFQVQSATGELTAIFLREPWTLEVNRAKWEVVAGGEPGVAMAKRSLGRGSVLLVGDSRFLTNVSLEGTWGYDIDNLRFLRRFMCDE